MTYTSIYGNDSLESKIWALLSLLHDCWLIGEYMSRAGVSSNTKDSCKGRIVWGKAGWKEFYLNFVTSSCACSCPCVHLYLAQNNKNILKFIRFIHLYTYNNKSVCNELLSIASIIWNIFNNGRRKWYNRTLLIELQKLYIVYTYKE